MTRSDRLEGVQMSTIRRWSAVALLAALTLAPTGAVAALPTEDVIPRGDLVVDGADVPVYGSFGYRQSQNDQNPQIRGLVHGVRRIDGGTALYFSIGAEADIPSFSFNELSAGPYPAASVWDVRLVDTANLKAYRAVATDDWAFVTMGDDLKGEPGQLRVGAAIFPELPDDVEAVQVVMPWGALAGEVPVEDGPMEPVSDEAGPRLGQGWPKVASGERLAEVDPARFTFDLRRVSSDLQKVAVVEESSEQVDVALDANVLFEFDSADLSADAQATIANLAKDIAARASGEVQVVGHTDSEGSDAYNQTLSEQRAQAVVAALSAQAGSAVTFVAIGRGESEPMADNGTPEGRAANRRVAVTYTIGDTP